jgi:hypothetical protein
MGTTALQQARAASPHEPSYILREFCAAERISKATYFKLRKMGLAPEELRYPGINVVRITHAARQAWHEMLRTLTGEQAAAVQRTADVLRERGRRAAAHAVASHKHVSRAGRGRSRRQREVA